jgi:4-amino-4-deoxy-L-arabinose transferase-like glycosyltransferase
VSVGTLPSNAPSQAPAARAREAQSLIRGETLVLGALVILAAALRFYRIGHQGFWFDEGNTAQEVGFTPGEMLTLLKHYESTPPLYYGIAWVWARIFGFGEVGLRSLSAVAGVLAVPVGYFAARKLVSPRAGLIAAALVAFNPYLIWYSQEARAYSLVVLLTGGTLLAFAYARDNPSGWVMAAWVIASGLALTTEYYAVLVVAPEALWLLYLHRRRRSVLVGMGALAAWCVPLLWFAISQNATGHASWIAPLPLGPRVGQIIPQFLVGYASPAYAVLTRVAEAIALVGVVLLFTRTDRVERSGAVMAGSIALGGLVLNLLLIGGGIDDLITRNVISLWMPAAVALAGGLAATRAPRLGLALTAALCAIGVAGAGAVAFDSNLQRPDWRAVARLLGPRPAPGSPGRAILVQRYRTLLPLSLSMPGLTFVCDPLDPRASHRCERAPAVSELDIVAMRAPRPGCWWGAVCDLAPSKLQNRYPIPGFHVVWVRHSYPFSVMRMVANHGQAPISVPELQALLRKTTLRVTRRSIKKARVDELLWQPGAPAATVGGAVGVGG